MYWSLDDSTTGLPAPVRNDFLYEGSVALDSSGNYTSSWFDTNGISKVMVVPNYNSLSSALSSFLLEEAMTIDGVNLIYLRAIDVPVSPSDSYPYAEFCPAGRFIRFAVTGGSSNANGGFMLTVRAL